MMMNDQRIWMVGKMMADACTLIIAYLLAYYLRFNSILKSWSFFQLGGMYDPVKIYAKQLIFLIPLYLVIYYLFRLYQPKFERKSRMEVPAVILADTLGIVFFLAYCYLSKVFHISRKFILLFFILHVLLGVGERMLLKRIRRAVTE